MCKKKHNQVKSYLNRLIVYFYNIKLFNFLFKLSKLSIKLHKIK